MNEMIERWQAPVNTLAAILCFAIAATQAPARAHALALAGGINAAFGIAGFAAEARESIRKFFLATRRKVD